MRAEVKPDGRTVEITLQSEWRFLYYEGEPIAVYDPNRDRFLFVNCNGAAAVMVARFVMQGEGVMEVEGVMEEVEPEELVKITRRVRCGAVPEPRRKSAPPKPGEKVARRVNL